MSANAHTVETLILLVGSNPLPNYLAAATLSPRRAVLLHTSQTHEPAKRLSAALRDRLCIQGVELQPIKDGTSARDVRTACGGRMKGAHLNYTGGTKVMAAAARMAFHAQGGVDYDASYVDEREGVLRFDDPGRASIPLQARSLDLDTLVLMHGYERKAQEKASEGDPNDDDARAVAKRSLADLSHARSLYEELTVRDAAKPDQRPKAFKAPAFRSAPLDASLSPRTTPIPEASWSTKTVDHWIKFLRGVWLEDWVADQVRAVVGDTASVDVGVELLRDGRAMELDVVVIRGHRLYLLSCTTDTTLLHCKPKLFEASLRAQQVGGALARSALVCMLHGGDDKVAYARQLRTDIKAVWDAPNTPQVFDLAHLRAWAGVGGEAPDTSSLCDWLDH